MVVEFRTNLVDSSYLGCPMLFEPGFKKTKQAKKTEDFVLVLTKTVYIYFGGFFFNWLKLFGKKYRCEIC